MSGTGRSYDVIAKLRISRDQPIPMKIYTLNREIALIQKLEQLSPARYGEMEYARGGLMFAPFTQPYNFAGCTLYQDTINLRIFQEYIFPKKRFKKKQLRKMIDLSFLSRRTSKKIFSIIYERYNHDHVILIKFQETFIARLLFSRFNIE